MRARQASQDRGPERMGGRRQVLALVTLVMVVLAAACGGSGDDGDAGEDDAAADTSAEEGWTFEDDRGITHELPAAPTTIAAQSVAAGGLAEYGVDVEGVFGPLRRPDGTPDPAIGLADPDEFTSLGEIDSQINLEALASLQPDIIVTAMWGDDTYWGIADEEVDELEQIAPIVGIRVDDRQITEPLARFAELAESLGADPDDIASARELFEQASAGLADALEAKPGLAVAGASGTPAEMYVAYPPGFPDLSYYQSLGMDLVTPESHPTSGGFWETLSWEEAGKYPVDLILADARGGTVPEILALLPATAASLPAVEADQLVSWKTVHAYGYGNLAEIIDDLTDAVDEASADIVP